MADKSLGITANLNIDDVLSGLNSLIDLLNQIPQSIQSDISVDGLEQVDQDSETANLNLQQVGEAAASSGYSIDQINPGELNEVASDAGQAATNLQEVQEAAASSGYSIDQINTGALGEVAGDAGSANTNMDEAGGSAETLGENVKDVDASPLEDTSNAANEGDENTSSMASSVNGLNTAVGAFAGLGFADAIEKSADEAGEFDENFSRIGMMMGETGEGAEQLRSEWSSVMDQMEQDTGRNKFEAQDAILSLGKAGLTSKDQVVGAFDAIAGAASGTNTPIENVENSFSRMVATGKFQSRSMLQLGINSQDVMNATHMSVEQLTAAFKTATPAQRAMWLEEIMNSKYGTQANDLFKESWGGVKDQAKGAFEQFEAGVGSIVLPVLIPALRDASGAMTKIGEAGKSIPGPIKEGAGAFLLFAGGLSAAYLVTKPFFNALSDIWKGLNKVKDALTGSKAAKDKDTASETEDAAATKANTTAKEENAGATEEETLSNEEGAAVWDEGAGSIAANTAATEAKTGATEVGTVATDEAAESQGLLNIAMSDNPVGIIILAITALIGVLMYLWDTNSGFRDAVTGAWNTISGAVGGAVGGLISAILGFVGAIISIPSKIGTALGDLSSYIVNGFKGVLKFITGLPGEIGGALKQITWNNLWYGVGTAVGLVIKGFLTLVNFVVSIPGRIRSGLATVGSIIISTFSAGLTFLASLPGRVLGYITQMGSWILKGLLGIPSQVGGGVGQIENGFNVLVNFIMGLPGTVLGYITRMGQWIYNGLVSIPGQLLSPINNLIGVFLTFTNWLIGLPGTVLNDVTQMGRGMLNYLAGLPGQVTNYLNGVWNAFASWATSLPHNLYEMFRSAMSSMLDGIKAQVPALGPVLDQIKGYFPASPPKHGPLADIKESNMTSWAAGIAKAATAGFGTMKGGVESSLGSAADMAKSSFDKIFGHVMDFKNNLINSANSFESIGQNMMQKLSSGLNTGSNVLNGMMQRISNMFPHSPPKEGPLADIKAENMYSWASSIGQAGVSGFSAGSSKLNGALSAVSNPGLNSVLGGLSANNAGTGSVNPEFSFKVHIDNLQGVTNAAQGKVVGNAIGEGITEKVASDLHQQMLIKGIKTG